MKQINKIVLITIDIWELIMIVWSLATIDCIKACNAPKQTDMMNFSAYFRIACLIQISTCTSNMNSN